MTNRMAHIDRRATQTHDQYAADDLETMREAVRYGAHVFDLLRPDLGSRILEVGCGIGTFTARLCDSEERVVGIEPNPNCVAALAPIVRAYPRFTLWERPLEACAREELARERFDTVVCVNVLEHIEDDRAAMRAFRDVLVPGGKVLIFVPAVQAAYGPLDAELGHFRRYSKRSLSGAFEAAGLEVTRLRYTNPIGLAGWMFNSHVTRTRRHRPSQVRLFERLVAPWALPLERWMTPPIGQSLIAVGVRP
jgi:2-polyprenyl-3-methyl-5-hydroxy-6-metoxy-1,4-benzoquinol methylase